MKHLLLVLVIFMPVAEADVRIGYMYNSNHLVEGRYNERHEGVIIEFPVRENHIGFMNYTNSDYQNSNTLYYGGTVKYWGSVSLGYQIGAISGYDDIPLLPAVNATITYNFGRTPLAFRLVIFPVVIGNQWLYEFKKNGQIK